MVNSFERCGYRLYLEIVICGFLVLIGFLGYVECCMFVIFVGILV